MSASRAHGRRRRGRRKVTLGLTLLLVLVALIVGGTLGYLARGDADPAGLQTVEREVPVVTVTVESGSP